MALANCLLDWASNCPIVLLVLCCFQWISGVKFCSALLTFKYNFFSSGCLNCQNRRELIWYWIVSGEKILFPTGLKILMTDNVSMFKFWTLSLIKQCKIAPCFSRELLSINIYKQIVLWLSCIFFLFFIWEGSCSHISLAALWQAFRCWWQPSDSGESLAVIFRWLDAWHSKHHAILPLKLFCHYAEIFSQDAKMSKMCWSLTIT